MKEQRIQQWITNFNEQIVLVETEFKSSFKQRPLKDYYQIKVHEDIGYISIEILNRQDLNTEIIDAITVALLRAKPRFKLLD
ncbi:hypothetical protein [Flavisolibacter ginsenosidimutans]|uniref:Uncharacterized protein n=1 Tax=Flavisolibacter ginsenosidimutans TaxID=661481 RepID=A0A5B8UJM1_9BACT|nr:hypothetical protein [Flavisolibacter ginsenosidimutans]QEC56602.1 hypothetical protein FSB75_12090 [Flavisolibacter ginsenosidimutans]